VETDVTPEALDDLNTWYDTEHLPGLAAVPGVARATRYVKVASDAPSLARARQEPLYHACYDLARQDVFGSPPWLAVRGTEWSARVRPHFRNTKRTMFRRVDG
jgi:hypothetical protein